MAPIVRVKSLCLFITTKPALNKHIHIRENLVNTLGEGLGVIHSLLHLGHLDITDILSHKAAVVLESYPPTIMYEFILSSQMCSLKITPI